MTGAALLQTVVFAMGAEKFALPITIVREILDLPVISKIPQAPRWLIGLSDVRGDAVPLLDLRVRLGFAAMAPTVSTKVLVVDVAIGDRILALGLVVDRVLDVCSFAAETVEAAPDIGVRWDSDHIHGVVRQDGEFVIVLDIMSIIDTQTLSNVDLRTRTADTA